MKRQRALENIGAAVARHQERGPSLDADDGLRRFREVVDRTQLHDRPLERFLGRRWLSFPALAFPALALPALAAAALLVALVFWPKASLTFTVDSPDCPSCSSLGEGEWLSVRDAAMLRFSDGTRATAVAGSRLRVSRSTAAGATLQLERGEVTLDVVSRPGAEWQVDAGPFSIHVTGTEFATSWDPVHEMFELRMDEGRVLLSGPVVGGQREVRAPEHLRVNVASSELALVDDAASDASASAASAGAAPDQPAEVASAATSDDTDASETATSAGPASSPAAASSGAAESTWRVLAQQGKHAEAVALLQSMDRGALLGSEPAAGLLLVAQTARLGGDHALASAALGALQQRFPDSLEAGTARFLRGKLLFDQGRYDDAATALSEYLASGGGFAGEAEVLLILALDRAGHSAEAKARANAYLERHPDGPHAARIRSIVTP